MSSREALILVDQSDQVATWTLNRPESLNAFNRPLLDALAEVVEASRSDSSLRCAILTGAGEKAFSAGADLKERASMSLDETREFVHRISRTFDSVAKLPFPTIAAVNGVAFGGGMELLLACDLRIFAEHCQVGLTEVAVGIMPGAGGTQRLPRLIGLSRAKDMIFTARRMASDEAASCGLANQVVPGAELLQRAKEWAARIAANAPLAVRQAKHAIDVGQDAGLRAGLEVEGGAYALLLGTQDRIEGLQAFAAKRKPRYRGE